LIGPDSSHISIKDPSVVNYGGLWHVFASTVDSGGNYSITYLNFSDWNQANSATHSAMSTLGSYYHAAPQVFYFTPQKKWYLIYNGGASYSTADTVSSPSSWSSPQTLASGGPSNWLDHWVICDATNCYLFFSADDGKWYRMQTTIGSFPGGWSSYTIVMQDATAGRLFEASNVYKMKGTDRYLALVEAYDSSSGGKRYFRSWTATSLDGTWTALADTYTNPFASAANVTFSGTAWTNDISHGEMVRDGYDETMTIDACQLKFLYQGMAPGSSGTYNLLPWSLGLLTKTN
jgi:endo-1,4-beta-xylanase